ncbi:MAG: hypothetical protein HFJ30_05355 [Clostridia bacterium]|jgi:hypothetical protein|nr:hypothetical protein [Clostridia bacterium]
MKSERGITLTALILYVVVAMATVTAIAGLSSFFVSNMNEVKAQEKYAPEFNKFSMFFIGDVKNNKTAEVTTTQVTFEDGTVYQYRASEKAVYRNDTKITEKVDNFSFVSSTEQISSTIKQIINVKMSIGGKVNLKNGIDYTLRYW